VSFPRFTTALLCLLAACGDTGQARVRIAAEARGSSRESISVGETRFSLTRAEVGFGPVYFCATEGAEVELCQVAIAELLETVTLDGLARDSLPFGELSATTGSVRSALFDYGISWFLTRSTARSNPGAPEGHSAILEGEAKNDSGMLRFSAQIDIEPLSRGDAAVNARRTSTEIAAAPAQRLIVSLDPYRWLERIDVEQLFALDVDGDGVVALSPEHQAYQAIVQGMTNRAPLTFEWSSE
jgi:hypothetical protein